MTDITEKDGGPWGRLISLSGGRLVFAGKCEGHSDITFIAFRNAEGHENFFALTNEALAALVKIQTQPDKCGPESTFPVSGGSVRLWKVAVPKAAADAMLKERGGPGE